MTLNETAFSVNYLELSHCILMTSCMHQFYRYLLCLIFVNEFSLDEMSLDKTGLDKMDVNLFGRSISACKFSYKGV